MTISKEFKVGLLFVIAATVLYLGFNFLKGTNFFSPTNMYYAVYSDIDGLAVSNQVSVNGMVVGRVSDISLLQNDKNQILVEMSIQDDIALGKGSVAILGNNGLIGGKLVKLHINNTGKTLNNGDTLASSIEQSLTSTLTNKGEGVLKNADSVMINVNKLLSEYQTVSKDIKTLLASLSQTSNQANALIAKNQQSIHGVLKNMNQLSNSLVDTEKQFKPLLNKFGSFADSLKSMPLKETTDNAQKLLANLEQTTRMLNKSEGTLGKLMHEEDLYNNLNKTLKSIDSLVFEFNDDPHRFLAPLGKKKKKRRKK